MLFLTLTIDIYIEVWTENSWTIIIIYLQRQRDKKWNQKCSSSFNNKGLANSNEQSLLTKLAVSTLVVQYVLAI